MSQMPLVAGQLNQRKSFLTPIQWAWLVFQLVMLVYAGIRGYLMNQENFSLLWRESLGLKLLLWAGFLLLLNVLAFAGGSMLLNKFLPSRQVVLHSALLSLLALACFYLLFLPVVFVLLNGPAALAIQRNLLL